MGTLQFLVAKGANIEKKNEVGSTQTIAYIHLRQSS